MQNRSALDAEIGAVFAGLSTADALARLTEANTAYGQVRSVADLAKHPALRTWPMPVGEHELTMIAPPVRAPWDLGCYLPAPGLGEHSTALRAEFSANVLADSCNESSEAIT